MKLLITGGAGFIGCNFVYYMLNKYPMYKIVNLDNLTYAGNLYSLNSIENNPNYKFIKGDICDRNFIFKLFEDENFDVVLNFAAESHVDKSIESPDLFVKTNVLGTQSLLDASMHFNITRYHQVSTDEVYGDLPLDRPDLLFSEISPLNPSSPYSASKASADLLVKSYFRTYKLPATISRCSNNYGPYQFPEKLIPLTIIKSLKNEPIPIYGNGLNIRDWLHVNDHCAAIDLIIHKGIIGEVYNVGGNNEKSNIDIVEMILKCLDKPTNLIHYVLDRPGHDLRYAIDAKKLESLGWSPKFNFESSIPDTIKWYLENSRWLEKISGIKI